MIWWVQTGSSGGTTGMSTAEMQSADFVETLNTNASNYNQTSPTVTACAWVAVNGSYPTLDFNVEPTAN